MNLKETLIENRKRNLELDSYYNPITGEGSLIPRYKIWTDEESYISMPEHTKDFEYIKQFTQNKYGKIFFARGVNKNDTIADLIRIRLREDFEFFAATCHTIKHKELNIDTPFIFNKAQQKLNFAHEKQRTAGLPERIKTCKARQWGSTTYEILRAFWLQWRQKGINACVVSTVENQALGVRAKYRKTSAKFPKELGVIKLSRFEGSNKNIYNNAFDCIISIGSMERPESLRSEDNQIAHCTEVGSWKETKSKTPMDLVQNIKASVLYKPNTMIVEESTAKGTGNYWHDSWIATKKNPEDRYIGVFVAWFEIEMYRLPIKPDEYKLFIKSLTDEERVMWRKGATLEGLKWYREQLRDEMAGNIWAMRSEYPSDDVEAFQSTGHKRFDPDHIEAMEAICKNPLSKGQVFGDSVKGEKALDNLNYTVTPNGELWLWAYPDTKKLIKHRYVVSVDIGGTHYKSDYSVIRIFDRLPMMLGGGPDCIGTYRGHMDQDLFAWYCAMVARHYNNALLIIEINLANKEKETEGEHFLTILDEIKDYYDNIYARYIPEDVRDKIPTKYGFHTNLASKTMIIDGYHAALRDMGYLDYDQRAMDECAMYEVKSNGKLGAVEGHHDDIVMATAIGYWACTSYLPPPTEYTLGSKNTGTKMASEAVF